MWTQFDLNVGQAFVDGAQGRYLDFIGDMMGISRLGEEPATVSALEQVIKFYVDSGTFGTINNNASIVIPQGTIISTQSNAGIQYKTVVSAVLLAGNSEGYVSAQSLSSGSDINVGAGQLTYHDFNNYTDSSNNTLKVTNVTDIVRGQDSESDANYRFRITNQLLQIEKANRVAIRLAALSVPGVADLVEIPYHRGIGTYDLIIKATTPTISTGLANAVQVAVENVTSMGIVATVRGPVEIGIQMIGTLKLRKKISAQEQTDLINSVTNNITDYINSLDIGEDFIVNEAVERVMSTSDVIKNIGVANKPFDTMYIYIPSKLEDNKVRQTLLGDYTPESDERIIVETEYAGATPILFRIG